jgi:protein ImuA
LSEVFGPTVADAASAGFVLAQIGTGQAPVLWIQDRLSRRETGRPYLAGMNPGRSLLLACLSRPADVISAAEEGLRCRALSAVVVEIWGNPPALNFTATKRLAMRAMTAGVPCWLIRNGGTVDLSAARDRWSIASLPSSLNIEDPGAPGSSRWRVELFRSRDKRPGVWVALHDRTADRLDLAAAVPDGEVAQAGRAAGPRAAR